MVEPAVDIHDGALARIVIAAVGIAHREPQAGDVAQPTADGTLYRLGQGGLAHADGIVEIGLQERQQFGAVIVGVWLIGDTFVIGVADAPALVAAAPAEAVGATLAGGAAVGAVGWAVRRRRKT